MLQRIFVPFALLIATCLASSAQAEVKLASIFGDHMILQRELAVPVWGWADPGETVTVSFADQKKTAKVDDAGRWQVKLDALEASADGRTLAVSGSSAVEIKDVLVGEVWFCAGQSNMEWPLSSTNSAAETISSGVNPAFSQAARFRVCRP